MCVSEQLPCAPIIVSEHCEQAPITTTIPPAFLSCFQTLHLNTKRQSTVVCKHEYITNPKIAQHFATRGSVYHLSTLTRIPNFVACHLSQPSPNAAAVPRQPRGCVWQHMHFSMCRALSQGRSRRYASGSNGETTGHKALIPRSPSESRAKICFLLLLPGSSAVPVSTKHQFQLQVVLGQAFLQVQASVANRMVITP